MARIEWLAYLLIPISILIHLFISPYTKVEESFNIQATHDIIAHGIPTNSADQFFSANYDHVSFPGSVPRTFVGAVMLAGLSRPWVGFFGKFSDIQILVRAVLGLANGFALIAFARSVQRAFGASAGVWYALLQASQFHVVYYASRTLPNMFAFVMSTTAFKCILDASAQPWNAYNASRKYRLCLFLLTVAGIVFRSELAILVGTITLYLFLTSRLSIVRDIIPAGLSGLIIGLCTTVPIDSYFWQSFPLWPEWTAFYYNTIQGHSADWGVSPWHFYFVNAIPRLLLNPLTYLLCIPIALLSPATRTRSLDLLIPSLAFVTIYSLLPHKEWRFIIYIVPALTGIAAAGSSYLWTRRGKSLVYTLLSLALVAGVLASFLASSFLLAISALNYPGGAGMSVLHTRFSTPSTSTPAAENTTVNRPLHVHFDNLACQTGVTRFLEDHTGASTILDILDPESQPPMEKEHRRRWIYDKTEAPERLLDPLFWTQFDYVLAERPEKVIGKWDVVHTEYGFSGIRVLRPGVESRAGKRDIEEGGGVGGDDVEEGGSDVVNEIARLWRALEGLLREKVFRGWWVEVGLEPRLRILRNAMERAEGV